MKVIFSLMIYKTQMGAMYRAHLVMSAAYATWFG